MAETIFLNLEEYEAIRLCDYEMLNHHQASILMAVSRPTLTRIYSKARQKIAVALVQGKQIIIEGGKIYFDSEWYSYGQREPCRNGGASASAPRRYRSVRGYENAA